MVGIWTDFGERERVENIFLLVNHLVYMLNIYFQRTKMETAKLFDNGNSQAIRLPKKYKLKGKEAYITKVGDAIVILPKKENWSLLIASLNKFSDDFMTERIQPILENREDIF